MRKRKLTQKLIEKSKESFLLSLEIYNKPTIGFRPETFSMLFTTAWELLIKAYIFEQSGGKKLSIYKAKKRNEIIRKSIDLDTCLDLVFTDGNHPVKRNIEFISEIRNEACHLYVSELSGIFSRAFQSGVVNYCKYCNEWFDENLIENFNPGMVSMIISDSSEINSVVLRKKYSQEDVNAIINWNQNYQKLVTLGDQAALSMEYKLTITKNKQEADFAVGIGSMEKGNIAIVSQLRNTDSLYPYKSKKVIEEVNKILGNDYSFTQYDLQSFIYSNQITKNSTYFYKSTLHKTPQFSISIIELIVSSIKSNNNIIQNNRSQYTSYLKMKRLRAKNMLE